MVLLRTVIQAKMGMGDQVVAGFTSGMEDRMSAEQLASLRPRILTDISGPFFTVVVETTHESLAALEQFRQALFARSDGGQGAMDELMVSGRNEYYTIEYDYSG